MTMRQSPGSEFRELMESMQRGNPKDGLRILARENPLSDDEWIEILESRRALLKPFLPTLAQTKLGQFECLRNELGQLHEINVDKPLSDRIITANREEGLSLDVRGIYFIGPTKPFYDFWNRKHESIGGVKTIWGLTRGGKWIVAKVFYREIMTPRNNNGLSYESTEYVTIRITDLKYIQSRLHIGLSTMWYALGEKILTIEKRRQELLYEIQKLAETIMVEELIMKFVPSK